MYHWLGSAKINLVGQLDNSCLQKKQVESGEAGMVEHPVMQIIDELAAVNILLDLS